MEGWIRRGELYKSCRRSGINISQHLLERFITTIDQEPRFAGLSQKTGGPTGVKRYFHPLTLVIIRALTLRINRQVMAGKTLKEAQVCAIAQLVNDLLTLAPLNIAEIAKNDLLLTESVGVSFFAFQFHMEQALAALDSMEKIQKKFDLRTAYVDEESNAFSFSELKHKLVQITRGVGQATWMKSVLRQEIIDLDPISEDPA